MHIISNGAELMAWANDMQPAVLDLYSGVSGL
jgi:hypothetical protein